MNRTEIIKDIVTAYSNTSWYTLRSNIETAIFASGKPISVYKDFPVLLEKSRNTVSDIWNREKKFVLLDVCKIAGYVGCNVFTLFNKFDSLLVNDFKMKDEENQKNEIFRNAGKLYIEVETLRKKGDKSILSWNIRRYVNTENLDMDVPYLYRSLSPKAIDFVMGVCGANFQAVRCWLSPSRDSRIHMVDLIKICEATGLDIMEILSVRAEK